MTTREIVLAEYRRRLPEVFGLFETHRPLSNFHIESFVWNGWIWPSSENAYQAWKSPTPDYQSFINMTPAQAKRQGSVGPLRSDWETIKVNVMRSILDAKFAQCQVARAVLLSTGNHPIAENNWWKDRFWGVCEGVGQNQLGRMLQDIRAQLQKR